ncbi:hypothetical protein [Parabacteroides chongii]|uniref:hypothetical protein n=1 Tax=Parabacteroides chongii TaxID=2685834 RepID=UPI00240D1757|nr:hypothetical protein [Parabacteroides chongii]WFE84943.1 hypothetical protein P3L47_22965 [Parabacteroides chongii]
MKVRQALKTVKQPSPCETDPKCGSYWDRYRRANNYVNRLYNKKLHSLKRSGKLFLNEKELDEIFNKINNKRK